MPYRYFLGRVNYKPKFNHLESGQKEIKAEVRGFGNRMERKLDKADSKADCAVRYWYCY